MFIRARLPCNQCRNMPCMWAMATCATPLKVIGSKWDSHYVMMMHVAIIWNPMNQSDAHAPFVLDCRRHLPCGYPLCNVSTDIYRSFIWSFYICISLCLSCYDGRCEAAKHSPQCPPELLLVPSWDKQFPRSLCCTSVWKAMDFNRSQHAALCFSCASLVLLLPLPRLK